MAMSDAKQLRTILAALALVTLVVGCSAISGRELSGEYVDDATITTKVKAEIFNDLSLKVLQINVETFQDVVQLSGFVDFEPEQGQSRANRAQRSRRARRKGQSHRSLNGIDRGSGRAPASGRGNLLRHYPRWLSSAIVGLLLIANIINLGADLGAMGAALKLLIDGPALLYVVVFGLLSAALEIFTRYARYVSILKWLCLSLFGYVVCAFVVKVPWAAVGWAVIWPPLSLKVDYVVAVVAVLGTTISPYLFFWQAQQEVEDGKERPGARPLTRAPERARREFSRIRIDTYLGMALSNIIAFFIVITTAATLNAHGVTDIETSAQAAEALRAVAGPFTFAVFAAGIIGTGLLTLPVLAGSAAYALGEVFSWHVGLARRPRRAKAFYVTIAAAMAIGIGLNFSPIDPIKALYPASPASSRARS